MAEVELVESEPTYVVKKPTYHDKIDAEAAISEHKTVLLQFSADWCGPCRRMSPVVDKVVSTMGDRLSFFRLNVDDNAQMSESYAVKGIPHFILLKGGNVVGRWAGSEPEADFAARLSVDV